MNELVKCPICGTYMRPVYLDANTIHGPTVRRFNECPKCKTLTSDSKVTLNETRKKVRR